MLNNTLSLLFAGLCATSLVAQAGPGFVDQDLTTPGIQPFKQSTYFTSSTTGTGPSLGKITLPAPIFSAAGGTVNQCSLGKSGIGGLAAGEFHMCMTVTNLSTFYGGAGGQDVIMGKVSWASGSPVFTPNTMANNLNTTGNVFGMMIDTKNGNYASVDWPTGPMLAYRAANVLPFDAPVAITGATGPYVDPAVAYVDDKLVLFWIVGLDVHMAPLSTTITGGKLTAASVGTSTAVISIGNQSHSPTPLPDSTGNVMGFWFASLVGSDSDMHFKSMLPSTTAHTKCWDTTGWLNNGGVAGGHFLCADSGISYAALQEGEGYFMMSNTDIDTTTAAPLKIRIAGLTGTPSICSSTMGISLKTALPVALPGLLGEFALDTTILLLIGGPTITTKDEVAELSLPSNAGLKGLSLAVQAVINPTDPGLTASFTSTINPAFK